VYLTKYLFLALRMINKFADTAPKLLVLQIIEMFQFADLALYLLYRKIDIFYSSRSLGPALAPETRTIDKIDLCKKSNISGE